MVTRNLEAPPDRFAGVRRNVSHPLTIFGGGRIVEQARIGPGCVPEGRMVRGIAYALSINVNSALACPKTGKETFAGPQHGRTFGLGLSGCRCCHTLLQSSSCSALLFEIATQNIYIL